MAEEEKIREHAKQALEALTDKKKKWTERLRDFLWEILIIVVAINLTLWFHNWSDKRHDRELEKDFLIVTRNDLNNLKIYTDSSFISFQPTLDYYDSVWVQINEHRIDKAFVDTNSIHLTSTFYFTYDNSSFENFKSSGYLRLIENPVLLKNIARLYSVDLPSQVEGDNIIFGERRRDFNTNIGSKVRLDFSGKMYVSEILNNPEVKNHIFFYGAGFHENRRHKKELLQRVEQVKDEIDQELKTRFKYEVISEKEKI